MPQQIVPMLHVPDVRATANWYCSIGFHLARYHEEHGAITWASLTFGNSEIMLNSAGHPSTAHRREVDLYIRPGDSIAIDALFDKLKALTEVIEPPHDTFYGMREFIIRDHNRFWLTFGHPI